MSEDILTNHQSATTKQAMTNKVLMVLGVWFSVVLVAALNLQFVSSGSEPPLGFLVGIAVPVSLFLIAMTTLPGFHAWVMALDMRMLIALHSFRMVGMGFVFLYVYDVLPGVFGLAAGLGDAAAAVGGLFIAIMLYSGISLSHKTVWSWNAFGMLDFVVAVGSGILSRPGGLLDFGVATSDPMAHFPLAMIPGFFVPLYVITHLIVFAQLKKNWKGKDEIGYSPSN